MNCPECMSEVIRVYDTRTEGRFTRKRSYVCMNCECRFQSEETIDPTLLRRKGIPPSLRRNLKFEGGSNYEQN